MEILEAFKFCPRCGAKFEKNKSYLHCPGCGLDQYVNPKPTATTVLINENNEILLVERAVDPGKGKWDFPGGFVEEDETFEENVRREAKEELDIEIGDIKYLGSVSAPYLFQEVMYPTLATIFITKLLPGQKLQAFDDVAGSEFFPVNSLPRKNYAFPAMNIISDIAIEFLKTNKF